MIKNVIKNLFWIGEVINSFKVMKESETVFSALYLSPKTFNVLSLKSTLNRGY